MKSLGPYSVSKTALIGLTKVLAQELGPEGIRVNCIAPGVIKTHFSSAVSFLARQLNIFMARKSHVMTRRFSAYFKREAVIV